MVSQLFQNKTLNKEEIKSPWVDKQTIPNLILFDSY